MPIKTKMAIHRYVFRKAVVFFQYLYKKLVATILPISNEAAMITTDNNAPENNIPIPLTEKKAEQPATNRAEIPTIMLNNFTLINIRNLNNPDD